MGGSKTGFLGVHHVSVLVADTARSLTFYRDVLGMPVDASRPSMAFPGAWLKVGGTGQQIHLIECPNPDPLSGRPEHGGRDRHCALSVSDLDVFINALEASGLPYTLSRSGRRALFCRDPDANTLELIEQA